MLHLFADEFAGLGGRRLAFALVFSGSRDRLLFWHLQAPLSADQLLLP